MRVRMIKRRVRSPGWLSVAAVLLAAGCGVDAGGVDRSCAYEVCDVEDEACIKKIAEAVACNLDREVIYPEVLFMTAEEYLAEVEADSPAPTAEEEQAYADYFRGLALLGLMPENYESGNLSADSFRNFVALYSLEHKHIVMISDRVAGEPQNDYLVMVHEMAHAYQDAEWDIRSLYDMFAPTYDRQLGVRALIEGDAVRVDDLAYVKLERLDLPRVDWDGYYGAWQQAMLEQAAESETPELDVTSLFPYAFGGAFTMGAWLDGGDDQVGELAARPPDSVRQVVQGHGAWPDQFSNEDEAFDPRAVAVLPESYELLAGGHESVWAINAMLQRTADGDLWSTELDDISAEYLAVWRANNTEVVAMWRIRTQWPGDLVSTLARGIWTDADASDEPTTHLATVIDGDVVLIAVSSGDARPVLADITGWQSPEEAFPEPDAGASRRPRGIDTERLGCVGHAEHRPGLRAGE